MRLNRGGTSVVSEELEVPLTGLASGRITVTVDNGDNPPLAIASAQLLSTKHTVYFDPSQKTALTLYYGDDKLEPPLYDYAHFFRADPDAVKAELGPAAHNEAYRGRPDERPWSERHNTILWLAMLAAAAVLAAMAIRGLKTKAMSSSAVEGSLLPALHWGDRDSSASQLSLRKFHFAKFFRQSESLPRATSDDPSLRPCIALGVGVLRLR